MSVPALEESTPGRRAPRVLVVAYDFPPHAAIGTMRTLRVVRQLAASGWHVTVLTSDPAHFLATTPHDAALLAQVPASVTVLRAGPIRLWDATMRRLKGAATATASATRGGPSDGPGGVRGPAAGPLKALALTKDVIDAALSIPDREIGWLLPALSKGLWARLGSEPPDVIYSSAPPWTGQLVALGLKAMYRRPWVADFRDPWSRAPWRGDRYRFALRTAAWMERRVVKKADRIVFVADGNLGDFAAHYGARIASKFRLVPNGCDPSEFDSLPRPELRPDAPHVMLHAGSLYAGRTPAPVFRAVAEAIASGRVDRHRFRLRFLGTNAVATDLARACRESGIEDVVEFLPRMPRAEGLQAMVSASSLLLLQPGHTVSVPGKVYEYLAAARPIFAVAEEGETADIVRRSGIGVSVTPADEQGIVDGLLEVIRMSQRQLPAPARELYDGYVGAGSIERLLRSTIVEAGRGEEGRQEA